MPLQLSVAARNARLDSFETAVGVSPKLRLLTGVQPANCAAAESGTLLCEITLPADFMAPASGGSKAKSGTWAGIGAATGTVGYFRIVDSSGSVCHMQGNVTGVGGGGNMTMDNTNVASGQNVTANSFTITDANA